MISSSSSHYDTARKEWQSFWSGQCTRRPLLKARVQKGPPLPAPQVAIRKIPLMGMDQALEAIEAWLAGYAFLGADLPGTPISFTPDHLALLLGAELDYEGVADTGEPMAWVRHFLDSYDQEIRFRPESRWWNITVDTIRALRNRFDGRIVLSAPHLQGGLDALSAIRGNQNLLMDMVLDPQGVHHALKQIDSALLDVLHALIEQLDQRVTGSYTRHQIYCPGLLDVPQCDFSCMISQEMFNEFGLPSLTHQCEHLDYAVYHLDGPDAIRHLEAICTIKQVKVIQWQPGAGEAATQDWSELHERIDRMGRGQLHTGTRAEIRKLWQRLIRHNVIYTLTDITTEAELQAFADELENTSRP